MRRKAVGRDFTLSVRMAAALAVVAAIYLVAEGLLLVLLVSSVRGGDFGAILGALLFGVSIPVLLVVHARDGGRLALRAARAHVLSKDEDPELHALGARVAEQADVVAPRVALVESSSANAFAVSSYGGTAVIAVTTELRRSLSTQELEAVVGHELSHIVNRDGNVMTFVSGPAMAGSALWHGETGVRSKFLFGMYSPIYVIGLLLMWSMSRYREYVADRGSALITGAPEQLMSALVKIGGQAPRGDLRGGAAISALCIVSARPRRRFELFMDHPPLDKRLRRLEEMAREMGKPVR